MKNKISLLVLTSNNGNIEILLEKEDIWQAPSIDFDTDLETSLKDIYDKKLGFKELICKQVNTIYKDKILFTNYVSLKDYKSIKQRSENLNVETKWFSLEELPKLDKEIIDDDIDYLKYLLMFEENVRLLYPETFTLPELKKVYDKLYNIDIDRRNFRKKLVNQNIVTETDEINKLEVGRPAKLYRLSNENNFINFREDL
jgi:8-oxo-dGTP diphosphatase